MTDLPAMTPGAEERAKQAMIRAQILAGELKTAAAHRAVPDAIEVAYRDGAAAERARILALLREPDNEMCWSIHMAGYDADPGCDDYNAVLKMQLRALADEIEKLPK